MVCRAFVLVLCHLLWAAPAARVEKQRFKSLRVTSFNSIVNSSSAVTNASIVNATANTSADHSANATEGAVVTPSWDYKTATFLVSGAGDPEINGCFVFSKFSGSAFSMSYVSTKNPDVYMHYAKWRYCSQGACRHTGWFLTRDICTNKTRTWETPSCEYKGPIDAYFMKTEVVDGKLPGPAKSMGCPPMMDKSTGHPEARANRSDSNSSMYVANCDEPPPTVTMNGCSASGALVSAQASVEKKESAK